MLVLIKLFVPFIFEFLSSHEMTIDDTHIFSVDGTISLPLHAFIYFGEIPLFFALLLSYFSRWLFVELLENIGKDLELFDVFLAATIKFEGGMSDACEIESCDWPLSEFLMLYFFLLLSLLPMKRVGSSVLIYY